MPDSSPFGQSLQGGYQGPPTSMQAAPQQNFGGGAGYGGYGGFGGFQPQQQSFGGFGGFNPMFGGLGGLGFNPMMGQQFMQPMPFFGGFGGMPMGYGGFGGFSPYQQPQFNSMFGGLGGLGYNPMMGGQFGMPMRGAGGMGAAAYRAQQNPIQFDEKMPTEQDWTLHAASAFYAPNTDMEAMKRDFMSRPMRTPRNLDAFAQPTADQPRQSMFGGLGGLGFNPMMERSFAMPMLQGMPVNSPQGRAAMGSLGGMNIQPQITAESAADINRAREQRENMQMQNIRSNWSQAAQGATSGMDFLQRLQGQSGDSYVPLSGEQMALERDARLYSMTPQQRAIALG